MRPLDVVNDLVRRADLSLLKRLRSRGQELDALGHLGVLGTSCFGFSNARLEVIDAVVERVEKTVA